MPKVAREMAQGVAGPAVASPNQAVLFTSAAPSWTHYPETTDVQVRCKTADSGGCNDWFIDPIGLTEAVGRLVLKAAKNNPAVDEGDFDMRFHIHVTRP